MAKKVKDTIFRNSMSGYNKKDVALFINDLKNESQRKLEQAQIILDREKRRSAELTAEIALLKAQVDELAVELYKAGLTPVSAVKPAETEVSVAENALNKEEKAEAEEPDVTEEAVAPEEAEIPEKAGMPEEAAHACAAERAAEEKVIRQERRRVRKYRHSRGRV